MTKSRKIDSIILPVHSKEVPLKKKIHHVRELYVRALELFPRNENEIGRRYEEIMTHQMGDRTCWISNSEVLHKRPFDLFIGFQRFVEQLSVRRQTSAPATQDIPVVLSLVGLKKAEP